MNRINTALQPFYITILKGKEKKDAHNYLLKVIADHKTKGLSYEEILDCFELKDARELVASKFEENEHYPFFKNIVTYIYTRDEVLNPFGPWVDYNFFLPLACFEYAKNLINKKNIKLNAKKLGGVCFAILCLSPRMKPLSGNKRILHKPYRLYQIAGINQQSFDDYAHILKCKYEYVTKLLDGNPKTSIEFKNLNRLTNKLIFSTENLIRKYIRFDREINFTSGIDFTKGNFKDISYLYESKYLRDKFNKFHYRSMIDNPFIRIKYNSGRYILYTQLNLLRYDLLLKSLYQYNRKPFKCLPISEKKSLLSLSKARLNKLAQYLNGLGITAENLSISSPVHPHDSGEHFNQIRQCFQIIKDISKNGIYMVPNTLNELTLNYKKEKLEIEKDLLLNDSFLTTIQNEEIAGESKTGQGDNEKSKPKYSRYKKVDAILEEIERIKDSIKEQDYKDNRLRGVFTAHGANTHRMNCRKYNLQGVSREIKKIIFTSPYGWKLLSADVSGQDIVVGAALARRIYLTQDDSDKLRQIEQTIAKLSFENSNDNRHKPIDRITDLIANQDKLKYFTTRKSIRDTVKIVVYTTFYGGGLNTMLSEQESKFLNYLNEKIQILRSLLPIGISNRLNPIPDFVSVPDYLNYVSQLLKSKNLIMSGFKMIFNKNISIANKAIDKLQLELSNAFTWLQDIKIIYATTIETIKEEYPGIIESLDYYEKYFVETGLTYPTFLGWQTIPDLIYEDYRKITFTRSKSYTVQASGAEFLRQWIIELAKVTGYGYDFRIVNVIHDQIMIEVKESHAERLKRELKSAAHLAAKNIGITPEMIKIPEIEVIDGLNHFYKQQEPAAAYA